MAVMSQIIFDVSALKTHPGVLISLCRILFRISSTCLAMPLRPIIPARGSTLGQSLRRGKGRGESGEGCLGEQFHCPRSSCPLPEGNTVIDEILNHRRGFGDD